MIAIFGFDAQIMCPFARKKVLHISGFGGLAFFGGDGFVFFGESLELMIENSDGLDFGVEDGDFGLDLGDGVKTQ